MEKIKLASKITPFDIAEILDLKKEYESALLEVNLKKNYDSLLFGEWEDIEKITLSLKTENDG